MTTVVTRLDLPVSELRRRARLSTDTHRSRRLLALALVIEESSRGDAARAVGAERQAVRGWVLRYNAEGVEGLKDRPKSRRKARLSGAYLAAFEQLVEQGPNSALEKLVRWRYADLKAQAQHRYGVVLSERSVGRILNQLGFARLSVRPQHPEGDPEAQEVFFGKLRCYGERRSPTGGLDEASGNMVPG